VKVPFGQLRAKSLATDDPVEAATLLYKVAYLEYHDAVDKNAELCWGGVQPSDEALLQEEEAYERLDSARQALFNAAALANPTIH